LSNLEADIGGPRLYAKRDDAYPLAFGGNKVRQLEFYFGDAIALGADTVLITGAVQSNYCRTCAAFAAKLGMDCHIQQEERVATNDPLYRASGNVLVERLLGARLHPYPHGEDEAGADARLEELAEGLRAEGRNPYVIHLGPGHPPLGTLGYVAGARELVEQLAEAAIDPSGYVVPSGSGATHAGFLFGLRALGVTAPVLGVCVRRAAELQVPRLTRRCAEIADLLGIPNPVEPEDIEVTETFLAPGYGIINDATRDASLTGACREALMLDPTYSGKAMAGFLDRARGAGLDDTLVFIHTGGTPGIFAYGDTLSAAAGAR
jgi:1-aminocyclopropane-1-carboxylate deaminase/D-cysteine desulfhydrase-like pyridoxal-dependent ACC family enzyme